MRFRSIVYATILVVSGGLAFGQQSNSPSGTSQTAGATTTSAATTIKPGSTITLDQAINIATTSSLSNELSNITLGIAKAANALTHGLNGITLTPSASYSHSAPYKTTPPTLSSTLASQYPIDTYSGALKATVGSTSNPITTLSLQGAHEIASEDNYQITQLTASLTQTIWDGYLGGTTWLSNSIADLTLAEKVLGRVSDRESLVYQVKQAYYAMASAQDTVVLDGQILLQRQKDYDQTETLFKAGQDTSVDLMQADVNRQTAVLALSDAKDSLNSSRKALSALIGVSLETEYSVKPPAAERAPTKPVNDLINTALGHRIDLQQLVLQQRSAKLNTNLEETAASPIVTADAGVSYTHDWTAKTTTGTWNAGVQVDVPLSLSGTVGAEVRQAKLQERSYQVQIDQLQQGITQSVQQDYDSVRSLEQHVKLAQQSVDLAQKEYQLVQIQFRQGTMSQLDVLTDSVAVSQARTDLQAAQTNLQLAILKLQNSMGE